MISNSLTSDLVSFCITCWLSHSMKCRKSWENANMQRPAKSSVNQSGKRKRSSSTFDFCAKNVRNLVSLVFLLFCNVCRFTGRDEEEEATLIAISRNREVREECSPTHVQWKVRDKEEICRSMCFQPREPSFRLIIKHAPIYILVMRPFPAAQWAAVT